MVVCRYVCIDLDVRAVVKCEQFVCVCVRVYIMCEFAYVCACVCVYFVSMHAMKK